MSEKKKIESRKLSLQPRVETHEKLVQNAGVAAFAVGFGVGDWFWAP